VVECPKRHILILHHNIIRWWLIWLHRVSMLCQLHVMVLKTMQNCRNHWCHEVQTAHQAVQDSASCHSGVLMDITYVVTSPTGPRFRNDVGGIQFWPSRTTRAPAWHCSFSTQNFCVITTWSAVIRFGPVLDTLGVVTNTERFHESWNLCCISVGSSSPISVYKCNISTVSAKYFVSHHFRRRTWLGRGHNSMVFCGGGELGRALSIFSCSRRSVCLDASSWSWLGYSEGSLKSNGRNLSLSLDKLAELTHFLSVYSSYQCPESSLRFSVSPYDIDQPASCHLWTLHSPEAPHEVYRATRVLSFAWLSSVHCRSMRGAFTFSIQTNGITLACVDSNHLLIIQGFAICIIRCSASCVTPLSSVQIAVIKLFTAEHHPSAPCSSITVLSSESFGAPE